jgi:glycosyltransferase involved in cell wall biosynthesis
MLENEGIITFGQNKRKAMKIRIHGLLGTSHSWAFTQQAIARAMMKMEGQQVFLKSTNGLEHFPEDLKHLLLPGYHSHPSLPELAFLGPDGANVALDRQKLPEDMPDSNRPYDLELAYTILYQIPRRFFQESACKMVIWNFESSIMPSGWQLYHHGVDYILPSSQYSSDIFLKNGVPSSKLVVVPHGVYREMFHPGIPPFKLHTQKKVKLLHNAIPHHRKLHERVLGAYLEAFTGDDDVCLVLKTKFLQPAQDKPFEVDVRAILEKLLKGRVNPPEIEVVTSFVPDIGSLYTACDAVVSMSSCEGFWLPGLEALACGCVLIAPRHGGQLDFLNNDNALLVDTGEMKAPLSMQYWTHAPDAIVGDPDMRHCAELMRRVYENPQAEKERIAEASKKTVEKFTWEAAAKQIMSLAEDSIASKKAKISTPQKRSVMYVVPYNMAGGGEVWVREAIKRLDRNRYEPSVAFPLGTTSELLALFDNLGINMYNLKDQGTGNGLKCLIESKKPDIVHFYNSLQVYVLLLRTLQEAAWNGRLVETVHSELIWPDSMMKMAARRGVSMIIGVSQTICAKLSKMGNKNIVHLPQQIAWEQFGLPRSKDVLKEIGCPTDRFTVGTVARLSPEKNIPMVLACAKAMPDAMFVIVGDGPQAAVLKGMAAGLGNVVFTGHRTDVERFHAAFDAFLLTSNMEGLPLTILEALASGTPVVASKVGAVPEVVTDGVNGFVVPGGAQAYVAALNQLRDPVRHAAMSESAFGSSGIMMARGGERSINTLYDALFQQQR